MTSKAEAFLRVLSGPMKGGVFVLKNLAVFEIGRGDGCQVRVDDPLVAHNHARIYRKETSWVFFDLNSERGSSINDIKVEKRELSGHEVIRVGTTELMFTFEPPAAEVSDGGEAADDAADKKVLEHPSDRASPETPTPDAASEEAAPPEPAEATATPEASDDSPTLAAAPPADAPGRDAFSPTIAFPLDGVTRLVVIDGHPSDQGKVVPLNGVKSISIGRASE